LFILIALFVLLKRFEQPEAHVFHWISIGVAMIMMMTWAACAVVPEAIAVITRTGFHIGYTFIPVLLIHFVLIFPSRPAKSYSVFLITTYLFAGILCVILTVMFIINHIEFNIDDLRSYLFFFDTARIFIALSVILAVVILVYSYKKSSSDSDKKKLKWIIYGICIGPFIFIFLWVLPQLILNKNFVPEELIIISVLSVPVCFSVSIIKYQLFDIDIIINRSVVYSILIAILVAIYTSLLIFITGLIEMQIALVISSILIGLLFHPIKIKVQKFVDRKFFKIQYDFRIALKELFQAIRDVNSIEELAVKIVSGVDRLIPVQLIGLFMLKMPGNRIKLIAHKNFNLLVGRSVSFQPGKLKTDLSMPVAVEGKFEPGIKVEIADSKVFRRWRMDIVFPLKSSSGDVLGFLVLGEKKSGSRFNVEDVDLLNTIAIRIASSIERVKLQEEVVREHLEAERLEELNRMKTFFVSSVSHDLKTPITSIKMFSSFIQSSESVSDANKEYLSIIEGESDRLTRLIDNVLNYSMIEKGIRNYEMKNVPLNKILDDVLSIMNYQLRLENFNVSISKPDTEIIIHADYDAVAEAVINLISNSIKYSEDKKHIAVSLYCKSDSAILEISDEGIGMSENEKKNIFNEFYQIGEKGKKHRAGVGLGLTIVKHVMDAHKVSIDLESEPSKGTKIKLAFPVIDGN
jgi:signal transduction histidine kinase